MDSRDTPALALENITVTFAARDAKDTRYTAVQDATLLVAPGEFVSVVGPTGCGKSTLLNIAVGLLEPSAGTVKVFGEPLAGLNRNAGYLFQTEPLMPWRTALDNVTVGLEFRGVTREESEIRAEDWLARVGLAGHGHRYPHQLSGGQQQRVALAFSLSDRVVVLSAGPGTRPIGEFTIDLPRPRDVAEIRLTPRFIELHTKIWHAMKDEVLKGYARTRIQ